MKNIKKIFAGMLVATAAFGFFGCSDSEDDEDCTVAISVTGSDSEKKVTIAIDSEGDYSGKDTHIIYTIDGSDPTAEYDSTASDTYSVNYGTASIYEKELTFTSSATIKARAFYVEGGKCYKGPVATQEISITNATSADSDDNAKGTLSFKLSSSGNSNMIHYFDTSDATFKYGDYEHCYYQLMFSYKGTSKGKWYLYYRQLANGAIIPYSDSQKYMASGDYTGTCFDKSDGSVTAGTITLKRSSGDEWTSVTVDAGDNPSFDLTVSDSATTLVDDAK